MFESVLNLWRSSRGAVLRKETVDAADRLLQSPPAVIRRCFVIWGSALQDIDRRIGPIANISNDGRREIAARFRSQARKAFKLDVGMAFGLFFLSAQLESSALPGDDAAFVLDVTNRLFTNGKADLDNDAGERLRDAIAAAKYLGAKTPREAAEIVMGRAISDEEWLLLRDEWEATWTSQS